MSDNIQLLWEENFLSMPFLLEDLPFLSEFDGPEVTLNEILHILANPPATTVTLPQHTTMLPVQNMGFHNFNNTMIAPQNNNSLYHQNTMAPVQNANVAAAHGTNPMNGYKKTCAICATRHIKCIIVTGSDPKVCENCVKKGFACTFEQKKDYTRKV